jgi:hypothetical protein
MESATTIGWRIFGFFAQTATPRLTPIEARTSEPGRAYSFSARVAKPGSRGGPKPRRPSGHVGSNPTPGTTDPHALGQPLGLTLHDPKLESFRLRQPRHRTDRPHEDLLLVLGVVHSEPIGLDLRQPGPERRPTPESLLAAPPQNACTPGPNPCPLDGVVEDPAGCVGVMSHRYSSRGSASRNLHLTRACEGSIPRRGKMLRTVKLELESLSTARVPLQTSSIP